MTQATWNELTYQVCLCDRVHRWMYATKIVFNYISVVSRIVSRDYIITK